MGERSAYSILYSTNDKNFNVNFNLFVGLLINKCFETTQYSAFSLACTLNFRGKITAERNIKTGVPITDTHFDCFNGEGCYVMMMLMMMVLQQDSAKNKDVQM